LPLLQKPQDRPGAARTFRTVGGFVVLLGVTQQHRGNGFGQLLLEAALAHFSRMGYSHAELGVDTENSSGALGLYEKMGFQVMSTTIEHSRPVD
jgi:ribosomal protein S18 acetylase RimI-like enzyme